MATRAPDTIPYSGAEVLNAIVRRSTLTALSPSTHPESACAVVP
jgi:hypothetical protein